MPSTLTPGAPIPPGVPIPTTTGTGPTTAPAAPNNAAVSLHTHHSAAGPGNIIITERQIADQTWPSTLILNLAENNWQEWSRRLTLLADRLYVTGYLDGSLICPDPVTYPAANHIWKGTDRAFRAFILERISADEYDLASKSDTSHAVFDTLRNRHEKLGLHAQMNLIVKALGIYYEPGTPMDTTSREIRNTHDRITRMGSFDSDKLLTVFLLNSLGRHYPQLQSTIHGMTDDPNFNSGIAFKRVDTEAALRTGDGSIEPELDTGDNPSWTEALASPDREYWIAGGREELKSLEDLNVFVLIPRSDIPLGRELLKGKLFCKQKRNKEGNIVRHEVRYVARGYAHRNSADYDQTTPPTVTLESFRTILHIAAVLGWDLQQFNVKTAVLHGVLPKDEIMYMEQPSGLEVPGKEDWVMKLIKSIYGMKQANRTWYETFHKAVESWGFKRLLCEWCVYKRQSSSGTIIFALHMDNIVSASSSPEENNDFKAFVRSQWEINDSGPPKFALGIAISRDLNARTISLSQTALIDRILEQFNQKDVRSVDTPMVEGLQLRRPDKTIPIPSDISEWTKRTPYRSLIGNLMHIAVGTRPDIAYAVGRLTSFLDCYGPEHWEAGIRVLRYLKGTRTLSLELGGQNALQLTGYSDSDYAVCLDTNRSVGGYCFSLGQGVISWSSMKQHTAVDSSCYAEYKALQEAINEAIFQGQLLDGLHFPFSHPTPIYCGNDAASILTEDRVPRGKHMQITFYYVRERITNGEIQVVRVGSAENLADILTKPLGRVDFQRLRYNLGLRGGNQSLTWADPMIL